ncbi:MAG: hypothetical protein QOI63_1357, partial [Thermoplasmata archaeon]|nr:hypothetical protein [Thermoplasmata archaeon]
MRTARRLFLVAAAALLVLAPGCFGTGGAAPPASSPTMAAHGALSTWLFAQGGIDGHRFSNDAAVTLATLPSLGQAWAAQTRGAVTGTPTVQDGHVFVATWKGMVYCLKVADGSIAWSRDLGSQVDGSVTLAPGLALVGDAAGRLHALDAATGKDVWVRLLDEHLHAHL